MKKQKKTDETNVVFVVDGSGSMQPFRNAVVENFNHQVGLIPRKNNVNVILFAGTVGPPSTRIGLENYQPGGQTALYDAVGAAIDCADDGETPALILVLTDGEENASRFLTRPGLAAKIASAQSTDRFTFAFMVPPGHRSRVALDLGLPLGNVTEWEQTEQGFENVMFANTTGTQSYFGARAMGATMTSTFYSDASSIKPTDLQTLHPIAAKLLPVTKEEEIREFVNSKGMTYQPGMAFYQLTKPEIVQTYKRIFIMEKTGRTVYGGTNVRNMLGLPYNQNAKVVPGNHANYDIFVESRSHNRKLVRGTKLVVVQ